MKNNLKLFVALFAIAAVTVGATLIQRKHKNNLHIVQQKESSGKVIGVSWYNGEWIPMIQLPEVTVAAPALKKSK